MILIKVFDKKQNSLIGHCFLDKNSFDWHLNTAHSFEFIPTDTKYLLGKFQTEQDKFNKLNEETFVFSVNKYKLLLRNSNPEKQFDDDSNSKWKSFQ